MLKRKAFNRIFFTTVAVFISFITYSFNFTMTNSEEINEVDVTDNLYSLYTINDDNYISMINVFLDNNIKVEDKVREVLEIMIVNNNKNVLLPSYFNPILPKNTKVNEVLLDDDILKIYFSKELFDITSEQSEKMIESITYTLLDFDGVEGIEIYVEKDLLKYVPNTKKLLPTVLTSEYGINKSYELTSNMDIKKINLYYYSKNNDDLYLIPITKYVNDKREKIEIIVEELSGFIYHDNLISMLSDNIRLIDYKISDSKVVVCFDDSIYNDNNSVSDLVIEPLLYSVFSNYDVDLVEINVDNDKILEKNKKDIEI